MFNAILLDYFFISVVGIDNFSTIETKIYAIVLIVIQIILPMHPYESFHEAITTKYQIFKKSQHH